MVYGRQIAILCTLGVTEQLFDLIKSRSETSKPVYFWPPIVTVIGHLVAKCVYTADGSSRAQRLRNRLDAFAPALVNWLAACLNETEHGQVAKQIGLDSWQLNSEVLSILNKILSLSLSQLEESYSNYDVMLYLCELVGTLQEELDS